VTRVARHPDEVRLGRRAAVSLVALLVAALTGIGLVLAHSVRQQQQSRVTAHLRVALQAALSEASNEAFGAQQRAAALAGHGSSCARGGTTSTERLTAAVPGRLPCRNRGRPSAYAAIAPTGGAGGVEAR
jgi:hypothetical protein